MKHIKKILLTITALTLILSMHSGCGMFTNYKAIAEQALEDKYGEEFVCHSTWDEGTKYCYAKLSPKFNENMKFEATISIDGHIIADEYIEKVVAEMCMDSMKDYLNDIGSKYTYYTSINDYNDIFSSRNDVTIESYFTQDDIIYPSFALAICFSNEYIISTNYENEYHTIISMLSDDELEHLQDVSIRLFLYLMPTLVVIKIILIIQF